MLTRAKSRTAALGAVRPAPGAQRGGPVRALPGSVPARQVPGAAEAVTGRVDAIAALAQRDRMTSGWRDAVQVPWLEDKGIALVRCTARLAGARRITVAAGDGTRRELRARRALVLATGTAAAIPPIEGLREARPWDNRDANAAKRVPARLLVLGGGAIGAEMAQAFRRLGSVEVTVVEGLERLLAREEPFAGEPVRAVTYDTGAVAGAAVLGTGITGMSKLVVDTARQVVVGATFTGPEVQELLHAATMAIAGAVPLEALWHAVLSFPTVSPDGERGVAPAARNVRTR